MTSSVVDPELIARAADVLKRGGLVAFPTETVYGLGADATSEAAVARVFAAKGRPAFNPLIVHVRDAGWVAGIAQPDGRFDAVTRAFWPGPLTLVMRRRPDTPVAAAVSAGKDTVAVRAPDHPVARALLDAVKRPLAAPSANPSGRVSPTTAGHVREGLGAAVDLVIDAGPCRVGLESTVLDLTRHVPAILRPGAITREQLQALLGQVDIGADDAAAPSSPGQLPSHYAPRLPLRLNARDRRPGEALLGFADSPGADLNLSPAGDLAEAAANLFAMLRALDDPARFSGIAVAPIPAVGLGVAINDRLARAAAPR
ncbi:MAG: L-threonylcarbamoyladenylate synthase [Rhodospirillaceae bacterium]|nr:L-threonylcarbamoyladenylate synthase [Rhodospirillaceae bacterium]